MNIEQLRKDFEKMKEPDKVWQDHHDFCKELLADDTPEAVNFHYELLRDRSNWELYQRIRSAFKNRGKEAEVYLTNILKTEKEPEMCADILHLLGLLRSRATRSIAREFITSDQPSMRHVACYVLGWVGHSSDIPLIEERLLYDSSTIIRSHAATALRQLTRRLPKAKDRSIQALKRALLQESNESAQCSIIISLQTIMRKKLGLRENINEAEIVGDVGDARKRAMKVLEMVNI